MKGMRKKGFTIVEIIIVIVIIGVIAGIAIPSVVKYLRNSKDKFNSELVTELGAMAKEYYSENKDELPRGQEENGIYKYSDILWASELEDSNYITGEFVDANNNSCVNKSYVFVNNDGTGEYEYKTCVICDNGYISDEKECNFSQLDPGSNIDCNDIEIKISDSVVYNNVNYMKSNPYKITIKEKSTSNSSIGGIRVENINYMGYSNKLTYSNFNSNISTLNLILYGENPSSYKKCSYDINTKIDDDKPEVKLTSDTEDDVYSEEIILTCVMSDPTTGIKKYIFGLSGDINSEIEALKKSIKVTKKITENGTYICEGYDYADNKDSDTIVIKNIVKKPSVPTITASDSITSGNWHKNDFTLKFNSTLKGSAGSIIYKYSIDNGKTWIDDNNIFINTEVKNVKYLVKACNSEKITLCSDSATYVVKLDKNAPDVTFTNNTKGSSTSVKLSCVITDSISGISKYVIRKQGSSDAYTTLKTPAASKSPTKTVDENGTYECIAVDAAGKSTTKTVTVNNIIYAPTLPTITANDSKLSGSWHIKDFTLKINGSTLDSRSAGKIVYKYSSDGGKNWTDGTSIPINTETKSKTYLVKACNSLDSNKCSKNASYVVKLDKSAPDVTFTNKTTTSSTSVKLSCVITDSISGISKYVIRKQGSSDAYTTLKTPATSKSPTKTVDENGTYECIAVDGAGKSTTKTVTVNNIIYAPTLPTITADDSKSSGSWHKANFKLTFSDSILDSRSAGKIVYKYSNDGGKNWTIGSSVNISNDTKSKTYLVKACNSLDSNKCSKNASYVVKLDKTSPIIEFDIDGSTAVAKCSDSESGVVQDKYTKNLTGTNNVVFSATCTNNAGISTTDYHTYTYSTCATGSNTCKSKTIYVNYSSCYYGSKYSCVGGYVTSWYFYKQAGNGKTTSFDCYSHYSDSSTYYEYVSYEKYSNMYYCTFNIYKKTSVWSNCKYTQNTCKEGWDYSYVDPCYYGENTCKEGFKL